MDSNTPPQHFFLDSVYESVRSKKLAQDKAHLRGRIRCWAFFHHSSIQQARAVAVKNFFGSESYSAGKVLAIGSMNLSDYFRTFGPYKVAGFFFGVKHLGLLEWVVMGRTTKESEEMHERVTWDTAHGLFREGIRGEGLIAMDSDGQRFEV